MAGPLETPDTSTGSAAPRSIDPLLLKVEEAAHLLSIGRTRVYDLLRLNELRSVKVFGSRRIPRAAVEEYVNKLMEEAA
ncbi:helix-turn-helix domain-containing protein [Amycolatopsis magusensis]|uniref:helix-turn-helix domain-containing protein n=1 Tax=Amycolatopsis magusensis TaxID=882444 RepID=UPI0024A82A69|nr:helix-turn-helix domain-containing protein [Amycolatopsis magusensis]MDI5974780.1 helix-turn-helix domain-containing protein [Amycolatopsis magusensis]